MAHRLLDYAVGLGQQGMHAFERTEIVRTLILALVALAFSYVAAVFGATTASPHLFEWTVGLWVVFLFVFIAPYRLWLSEKIKVEKLEDEKKPKLQLEFRFAPNFVENVIIDGRPGIHVRVLLSILAPVYKCRAVLRGIYRLDGNNWIPTNYDESLEMHWGTKGYGAIEVHPEDQQFLDVFTIFDNGVIAPWLQLHPQRDNAASLTNEGTYRFDIFVVEPGSPRAVCPLLVTLSTNWQNQTIVRLPDSQFQARVNNP